MNKILIIGGSGYLGRHLLKALKKNNEVFFTSQNKCEKENSLILNLESSSTYNNIDFNNFDIIFMLVSNMSGIKSKIMSCSTFDLNCKSYKDFLNHLVEINSSKNFVYISSMTVYSVYNDIPVNESGNTELPPNSYGLSKLFAEQLTKFYSQENDFKAVIIRIPGLFGGDRKSGFIYNAIDKISKNENFHVSTENLKYWETISVEDASKMIDVFLNFYNWKKECQIFNISYGQKTDIVELAFFVKGLLNSSSKISTSKPKGYRPFYLNNNKYLNLTNNFSMSFNQSLSTYINSIL